MDYTNYLTKSALEKLEAEYELIETLETTDGKFAIIFPWDRRAEFNVTILKIDGETLFLEWLVDNPYGRTYQKHTNIDFSKVVVFKKLVEGSVRQPVRAKTTKNRFIKYFRKKA